MAMNILTFNELYDKALQLYRHNFGEEPEIAGVAPGRVNIIGEHTDYNDGFVFPMALPMFTIVIGKQNHSDEIRVATESYVDASNSPVTFEIPIKKKLIPGEPKWANYFKGVVNFFPEPVMGFNAVVVSSVPIGSGLSSSASFEVAAFTFLEGLTDHPVESFLKAKLCQKAEHEFANVPCGIMDQLVSAKGVQNNLLLIDCRSLECEDIEIVEDDLVFLIINTNVKHDLGGGTHEYAKRKADCEAVTKILNIKALRDASMNDIDILYKKEEISEVIYRRARHVIKENTRVCEAAAAIRKRDYNSLGLLMNQSHNSLRFDYDVSCVELDALVDTAMRIKGVYGARMTGAGFGGCTVNLVRKDYLDFIIEEIKANYNLSKLDFIIGTPSQGARMINVSKHKPGCDM